jgi:hypothetical protein
MRDVSPYRIICPLGGKDNAALSAHLHPQGYTLRTEYLHNILKRRNLMLEYFLLVFTAREGARDVRVARPLSGFTPINRFEERNAYEYESRNKRR